MVPQGHSEIGREMARLVVNREGVDLVVHQLSGDVITIGRAPLNQIVIDHPTVSAQHGILARFGDSYRLEDLSSTNGIQINGVRINVAELKDGDKIRFGSVVAVFLRCAAVRSTAVGRGPNAVAHAIGYAMQRSPSHDAVIRVYDGTGNVDRHARAQGRFQSGSACLLPFRLISLPKCRIIPHNSSHAAF
jgi:hypothetical protein